MIRNCTFLISFLVFCNIGFSQIYGDPIVTWDFSNGIPEDWQVGVTSTNNIAQWEYRGPNTTPDFTVGARGSCSAIAVPIQSQSQENGFVIFDGNYWDDPGESCGAGFGTGTDPAPHTAWLITNPIDLSETDAAVLTFQQQYRHFQVSTSVYISTDSGSTWTEILVNTGVQSQSAEWKTINISQWAANQPSVQFKFEYNGTYYWWLLDDISIYRPNDNDLRITKVQYTTNQIVNGLTTLNALEYHQYPISMLPSLKFKADILNVGGNNQTGVRLNAKLIKNNQEEVLNQTSSASTVNAGASANLSIGGVFTPSSGEGDYKIRYSLLQNSSDDTPDNNKDSLDFVITPFTYGKDEGNMVDTYVPAEFYDEYQLTCGNYYENKEAPRYCHTIQVGIAEGTTVGKEIRGVIYNESLDSLVAATPTYVVNYGDINEPGEQRLLYLDFETPFQLQTDSLYFVGVEELDSIRPFFVARGGNSFGESSLARYNNINASIISGKSFLVRLTILPFDEKPGCTDAQAINYESTAVVEDGSCDYPGCTNEDADNYAPDATFDNGSCQLGGCIDSTASNFNPLATYQNTTCIYIGCTNNNALNYNPQANQDDGSCEFLSAQMNASTLNGCPPFQFTANNINGEYPESTCAFSINGEQVSDVCSTTFQYEFLEPGTYELTYLITVGNAIDDTTITIEVFAEPDQPEIIYDTESHFLNCLNCANDNLEWQLDGETIENASSTTYNAEFDGITQNGDYQLIATNSNGCSINSEVLSVVQPHLAVSSPSGCIPFSVYLINTTDQIPGMTCSLNTGNTIIENFEGLIEVTFEEAGVYSPEITCSVGTNSGTADGMITAYALEIPILSLSDTSDVIICENYESFTQFIWNVDGEVIEGGISQPAGNSVYQLQAYNEAGCGGSNLFIAISTEEIHDKSVYAYPNPANDFFQVQSTKPSALRIVNSLSQLVFESSKRSNNHSISTSAWPSGLYFLQWSDDIEWHTVKFEINH